MKLIRFGNPGDENPGVILPDESKVDVSDFREDYDNRFFETDGLNRLQNWLKSNSNSVPVIEDSARMAAPLKNPGKIVCIGLNYEDHAREGGMEIPREPILFFKSTSSISGPFDEVIIPKNSKKTDWEVELAVIIGRRASYVTEKNSMDYVAGYCVHNDYSEREFQLERGGQWVKGKSCDTFAPIGPYIATKDEIKNVNNLTLWLKVNGELKQKGNTKDFIFKIPFIISYISNFMTLLPGDIISTGTPAGVGLGFKPPQFLKPGDIVELGIDYLGESRQKIIAFEEAD